MTCAPSIPSPLRKLKAPLLESQPQINPKPQTNPTPCKDPQLQITPEPKVEEEKDVDKDVRTLTTPSLETDIYFLGEVSFPPRLHFRSASWLEWVPTTREAPDHPQEESTCQPPGRVRRACERELIAQARLSVGTRTTRATTRAQSGLRRSGACSHFCNQLTFRRVPHLCSDQILFGAHSGLRMFRNL